MSLSLPQVRYCCETCGQPIDHERRDKPVTFEGIQLAANLLSYEGKCAKLQRAPAAILRAIISSGGKRSSEALIMLIGSESDRADEIVRVHISRTRRALESVGAPFRIKSVFGWGYELVPATPS